MTITSVQLSLTTNADAASENGTFTLQLFQLTSTFLESGVSWNSRDGTNPWTTAGGDFSSTPLSSVTANPTMSNTLTFDSSLAFVSAVQDAVDAGAPFYFIMKLDNVGESGAVRRIFSTNSDDAASVSQRPVLTVTTAAVPEPTTFALVGTGVAGLLAWRRRRGEAQDGKYRWNRFVGVRICASELEITCDRRSRHPMANNAIKTSMAAINHCLNLPGIATAQG